jgi:ER-bound oxygenase mpaB/B'/Rubber oxygenase, catalytic domain
MNISENLIEYRKKGDLPADSVIQSVDAAGGLFAVRDLMVFLTDFKNFDCSNQAAEVQGFIQNITLPIGADLKKIKLASAFYQKNQLAIGLALGCYALPYCYLGADGAKVLAMTDRIKTDTYNRLLETGEFVNGIMDFKDWQNEKQTIRIAKIRLMHAAVRYFVIHSKKWDESWGTPVNQEDMAGTNLAFSFIVLRGLRKMGYVVDEKTEDAYLHTWNVMGAMMGVDEGIIPHTIPDARRLDAHIVKRNFRPSPEGKALTAALLKSVRNIQPIPFFRDLPVAQTRLLLGNKYADMLDVPKLPIHSSFIKITNGFNSAFGQIKTILNWDEGR